jgi:hypothetical protein
MAEETRPADPEDVADDLLGKLDQLINRHRPLPADADPALPVLSDKQHLQPPPAEDNIPTLTDVVGRPARHAFLRQAGRHSDAALETKVIYGLAATLDAERARLTAGSGGDPMRVQALDELIAELKRALPAIVRSALSG